MSSQILGVHRLCPDKDRFARNDKVGIHLRGLSRGGTLFGWLQRVSALAGFAVVLGAKTALAQSSVTLAWNTDTDPTVVGYDLNYGTSSGSLTQTQDVGNTTTATVSGLTAGTTYFFAVTAYNAAGVNSVNSNVAVYTPVSSAVSTWSLFSASSTPGIVTDPDPNSVELGVKFQTSVAGTITGIRFYKGPQNVGTHVANLWTATGTLLATATFTNETASGWQQVSLPSAVTLLPGTIYIVSYHSNGHYAADPGYFATALTNGPLSAPASLAIGGNGVYAYGSSSSFPASTYLLSNYWVDIVFNQFP
jgi:Domain of unknown function (DUF4082)/Fibronectin type III domain